jgi:pseudaminic acid cytidylyltransferase
MKIAVIPARGGSKRIPRKNIRNFQGKPIIAYSIEAALSSGLFDEVIVSTEDDEIGAVAANYGASVPFLRPAALADDYTGTNAVVKHAIEWFEKNDRLIDYACCIYATAPLVQSRYLREGFEILEKSKKAFAFSVTSFPFPIQRAIKIDVDGTVEPFYPEHEFTRSQDLEHAYHDAGQFYWGRADAFKNDTRIFSSESLPIVLPRYLVQDIDTLEDWQRAEFMYKALKGIGE